MKKTIIGSVIFLSGVIISISILIAAALHLPHVTSWRGSKLWSSIFATDLPNGLELGIPFIIGIVLFAVGLFILVIEYFRID